MDYLFELSLLFIVTLVSSILMTKVLITRLAALGIVDAPDTRRLHNNITPRGGGLSLVILTLLGYTTIEYLFGFHSLMQAFKIMSIFLLIASVSFLDDLKAISVFVRLITHLSCSAAALLLLLFPSSLFHQLFPAPVDFILATICLTTFLNIYNFLDGADGITCIESIHLSITMLILCYLKSEIIINSQFIIVINTIILAFAVGFLVFNWYPARIFMGDVGTISIGFLIGLCLIFIAASNERLFLSAIIASLYYLADGGLTILIRLANKEKIWQPHLKHFFQKALKKGMPHREVVKRIMIGNFVLMLLAINALYFPGLSIILSALVVMSILISFAR